jgi:hypothetical protein
VYSVRSSAVNIVNRPPFNYDIGTELVVSVVPSRL